MNKTALISLLLTLFQMVSLAQTSAINLVDISGDLPSDIRPISNPVNAYIYTKAIDLTGLDVQNKKQAFINLMLPSILIAKYQLEQDRIKVLALQNKNEPLSDKESNYLEYLKKNYKCKTFKEFFPKAFLIVATNCQYPVKPHTKMGIKLIKNFITN